MTLCMMLGTREPVRTSGSVNSFRPQGLLGPLPVGDLIGGGVKEPRTVLELPNVRQNRGRGGGGGCWLFSCTFSIAGLHVIHADV